MVKNIRTINICPFIILSWTIKNFIFFSFIKISSDFLQNVAHFHIQSISSFLNEIYVYLDVIANYWTNCKSMFLINLIDEILESLSTFHFNTWPSVPIFWNCFKWAHQNHIIFFVLLNKRRIGFWKCKNWNC